jgi:glutathione S-transferase
VPLVLLIKEIIMQLIGSTTSPFVRRLRLFLAEKSYDFVSLDIFSEKDRAFLMANNPALKVPALIDEEQCIYDSRVIYRYLAEKLSTPKLSWAQENLLTLIDAANDSFVTLLLTDRSGLDNKQDILFFNLQNERVEKLLSVLSDEVEKGVFVQWHYPAICLFCLLDWIAFRNLFDLNKFPHLIDFWQGAQKNIMVSESDPRL